MDTRSNEPAPAEAADSASVIPIGGALCVNDSKKHFDTFETHFFQQGDDASYGGENGYDEALYPKEKQHLLSYRSMTVVTIASTAIAIAACVALLRSNRPATVQAVAVAALVKTAPMEPAPAVAAASPVPAPPLPAAPVPENPPAPSPSASPSAAAPSVAEASPKPAATPPSAEEARPVKLAEAEPAKVEQKAEAPKPVEAKAATQAHDGDTRARCRQSLRDKHARDVVAACSAAFDEDATDADAAVAVAKVEFDRGHFAQAFTWSKKALVVNPSAADAYVYAGGAEQNRGHGKAAKEAYLNYLRLAPSGLYATELRTIVNSL